VTTALDSRTRRPSEVTGQQRVIEQPAYILHRYPHSETSLLIDVFTRQYGRVVLIAKGAKRPYSLLRGALQNFQPLALSWGGKTEVRTLMRADWMGGMPPLLGQNLLYGFYLNELVLKFCAREDPYEKLFEHYVRTLTHLAHDEPPEPVLRRFEHALLVETGHAAALDWCVVSQSRVHADRDYVYDPNRGICPLDCTDTGVWPSMRGQCLIDIANDDYRHPLTAMQSKRLMRFLLHHHLQGSTLATRKVLMELQQL